MRFVEMTKLLMGNRAFLTAYVFTLVTLWVGATMANIALIMGRDVDATGLVAVSVFVAAMLVRAYRPLRAR